MYNSEDFLDEQLYQEWQKVKNTQRVLSIKNTSLKLARLSNLSIDHCQDILRNYLQTIEEALFVTPWQVIDAEIIKQKEFYSPEQLGKILEQEYFIRGVPDEELNEIAIQLGKRYQEVQDITNYAMEPQPIIAQNTGNLYRNYLSEAEKNINELIRFYSLWDSYSDNKRKWWKEHVLKTYLNKSELPQRTTDIIDDLVFPPVFPDAQNIFKVLHSTKGINNIFSDYWTSRPIDNDPAHVILWSQLLWQHCKNAPGGLNKQLLHKYVNRNPIFDINELLLALNCLGIDISEDSLSSELQQLGCFRISFNRWTANERYPYRFEPDFKNVIEYTLDCWQDSLKKKENQVVIRRIIQKRTLEEIGDELGLTRERIRQIEQKALRKLRFYSSSRRYLKPYYEWINTEIKSQGIIDLYDYGLGEEDFEKFHIMYEFIFEDRNYKYTQEGILLYLPVYNVLRQELYEVEQQPYRFFYAHESPVVKKLSSQMALVKRFLSEYFNLVEVAEGVYYYPYRKKLSREEEVFLIIHRVGRPLHFTEVEDFAQLFKLPFSMKGETRNILAIMQRTNRLRRTAPGTYGLGDWPIGDHIFLKDLIYMVLEEAQHPLNINEIYQEVQARRNDEISKNSIYAYLNMHPRIIHNDNQQYLLKAWLDKDGNLQQWGFNGDSYENTGDQVRERVLLEVFQRHGRYFTKYQVSSAYLNTNNIRISRTIKIPLSNKIAVIDSSDRIFLSGFSFAMLTGLKQWGGDIQPGDIFYLEFINDKVIRFHTPEQFQNYKEIDDAILREAEQIWKSYVVPVNENDDQPDDYYGTDTICDLEQLVELGLRKGYISGRHFEEVVAQGVHPNKIKIALEERMIDIVW